MVKVFLSLPMKGLSDKEIETQIAKMKLIATDTFGKSTEVVTSYFPEDKVPEGVPLGASPLWLLGKSFQMLSSCDAIIFHNEWKNARGCIMEYFAAKNYDMPMFRCTQNGKIVKIDNMLLNFKF